MADLDLPPSGYRTKARALALGYVHAKSGRYAYFDRMRVNPVSDHDQIVVTYGYTRRHFEVSVVNLFAGRHTHG